VQFYIIATHLTIYFFSSKQNIVKTALIPQSPILLINP